MTEDASETWNCVATIRGVDGRNYQYAGCFFGPPGEAARKAAIKAWESWGNRQGARIGVELVNHGSGETLERRVTISLTVTE